MPNSPLDPGYMQQLYEDLFPAPGTQPQNSTDPPLVNPQQQPQIGGLGNGQMPEIPAQGENPPGNPNLAGGNPPPGQFVQNSFPVARPRPPAPPPQWQPPAWWRPNLPPQFQGQGQLMPGAGNPGAMMQGMPGMGAMLPFAGQAGGNIFGGQSGTTTPQGQGNIFGGQNRPTTSPSPFASLPQVVRPNGLPPRTVPFRNWRPGDVQRHN